MNTTRRMLIGFPPLEIPKVAKPVILGGTPGFARLRRSLVPTPPAEVLQNCKWKHLAVFFNVRVANPTREFVPELWAARVNVCDREFVPELWAARVNVCDRKCAYISICFFFCGDLMITYI